jgi:glioma pathogenesis-related protein 2
VHVVEILGTGSVQAWYDEIKDYDYMKPAFSYKTGHFTQVIWKNTINLGVGIAYSADGRQAFVVANYSPPGNYANQFSTQVPKKC